MTHSHNLPVNFTRIPFRRDVAIRIENLYLPITLLKFYRQSEILNTSREAIYPARETGFPQETISSY